MRPFFFPVTHMPLTHRVVVLSILGAALWAVYWPGLGGGFIFDDFPNLVVDPHWRVTSLDPKEWQRAISHGRSGFLGRPLAMATFALNHYYSGADPFWLKLTNVGLHAVNAVLVYLLCRQLFALIASRSSGPQPGRFAATLVALAWAVHPLQVSTVLYVVQRMEIAATTCVLLALLAYLRSRRNQIAGARAWPWLLTSALTAVAGLGFKESALLAPGFALLSELCVLRFAGRNGTRSRAWVFGYAIATIAALAAYTFLVVPRYLPAEAYGYRDFSLHQRLLTQLPVLAMYLGQIAWPLPSSLLFYYDHLPVSDALLSPPWTAFSGAILLALLTLAGMAWRRWPLASLGIGWFFVAHALTSNVVPLELAFEHRNYLALLGILLAAATPLAWLGQRLNKDARRTIAVLPVVLLGVLCLIQTHTWGSPDRLAVALATRNIDSPRAGYALARRLLERAGSDINSVHWSMARKEFEHVTRINHTGALGEHALIIMAGRSGRPVPDELWDALRSKLTVRERPGPDVAAALYPIVACQIQERCRFDNDQVTHTLVMLLGRYPDAADLYAIYGNYAANVLQDLPLAIELLRRAHQLEPANTSIAVGLAKMLRLSPVPDEHTEAGRLIARLEAANDDGHLDEALEELRAPVPPGQ